MRIRFEQPGDIPAIRHVNLQAFEAATEADLVDVLRGRARPLVSIVAIVNDMVAGHILFSPVTLSSAPETRVMGLAPMAVLPSMQRQGIGSALVRAGLEECQRLGAAAIVVLGHAGYYPRFGFRPASAFGVRSEYDVPDDVFMALELTAGALQEKASTARYHPAFAEV
jgi:putative acetyltransferase